MRSGAIYTAIPGGLDTITVVVADGHGGTATQSTQFDPQAPAIDVGSVSGQYNVFLVDQSGGTPGLVIEDSSFSTPGSGTLFTRGAFGFTDADLTDTHTAAVIGSPVVDASHAAGFVVPNGGLGAFSPLSVTESPGSGQVPWTFTVDNALVQGLGKGQTITRNLRRSARRPSRRSSRHKMSRSRSPVSTTRRWLPARRAHGREGRHGGAGRVEYRRQRSRQQEFHLRGLECQPRHVSDQHQRCPLDHRHDVHVRRPQRRPCPLRA